MCVSTAASTISQSEAFTEVTGCAKFAGALFAAAEILQSDSEQTTTTTTWWRWPSTCSGPCVTRPVSSSGGCHWKQLKTSPCRLFSKHVVPSLSAANPPGGVSRCTSRCLCPNSSSSSAWASGEEGTPPPSQWRWWSVQSCRPRGSGPWHLRQGVRKAGSSSKQNLNNSGLNAWSPL